MKNNKILKKALVIMLASTPLMTNAAIKKETVFSSLNADGTLKSTIVNNYVCKLPEGLYEDNSTLNNIINLSGNESFTQNGNNIVWMANGKDIYYQGASDMDSPLDINIKYYLDNKEISAEDIKGKSGNVKIRISLTNKLKNTMIINGKYETVYTPFMVMAGTIISSENNTNIEVTNGRVINNGNTNVIISLASPGLYKSMNISDLSSLENIEFSFNTTNFTMDNIYIIATPKLIEENDINLFRELDDVANGINTMQDGLNEIEEGSLSLSSGTSALLNGAKEICSYLPSEEDNKANETKLTYLKGQNDNAVSSLASANKTLSAQIVQLDSKITYTENALKEANTKKGALETKITAAKDAYNEKNASLTAVSEGITGLEALKEANGGVLPDEQEIELTTLKANKEVLDVVVPLLKNQYDALVGTKTSLDGTIESLNGTLTLLKSSKESINTSISANKGLIELISGNNTVVSSSIETINSMRKLTYAMNSLKDGIEKVDNGAKSLNAGIHTFNYEGFTKLSNTAGILHNYSSKVEALVYLSNNYKGYSSNNANETIFVSKVDSIR